MKIIKKIILFLLLISTINAVSANSFVLKINNGERNIIKINSLSKYLKIKKAIDNKIETTCYDSKNKETEEISFQCKRNWLNKKGYGCGFVVNKKYTEKTGKCVLFSKINQKKIEVPLEIKTFIKKEIIYPKSYDITSKMLKLSIQKRNLSCEISATSDILSNILKKKIDEDELVPKLKLSGTEPKYNVGKYSYFKNGKRIWGDPREGFVGFIDIYPKTKGRATQTRYEGYGVYEKPINEIYKKYGVKTKIITNWNRKKEKINTQKEHLTYLLKEVVNGNYVQMWGDFCTTPTAEDGIINSFHITQKEADLKQYGKNRCGRSAEQRKLEWYIKKKDGSLEYFRGISGEHAFYLLGYKGNINNPDKIIVWDTSTGRHEFPIKEWLRKWNLLKDRSIIAYRK